MFFYSPNLPYPFRRATLPPSAAQLHGAAAAPADESQLSPRSSAYIPAAYSGQPASATSGTVELLDDESDSRHGPSSSFPFETIDSTATAPLSSSDARSSVKSSGKLIYKRPTVTIQDSGRILLGNNQ
ncbi:unnamed protein product [Enterobius vermicularis]|uniref:Uncharacterized protein n=1 Tax=Enterobius vermicularis TaxID=51028 RepID=A0A0N4VLF0_ENTVE|nr:unnamed protein product [Enterobius vermicularis]